MPNGRPGDSRTHDVVHHGMEVFGPSCDGLIREIAARLPPGRMRELHDIVETWPFAADGTPVDPDALFHRLAALRDRLGDMPKAPPRRGSVPATGPARPARRGRGRAVAIGLAVFLLAGTTSAVAAAILAVVIGGDPPSGDAAMGWAIGLVFGLMPIAFLLGGAVAGLWAARRAWPR